MLRIEAYWKETTGSPVPKNICYIIFDRSREIPYIARGLCGIDFVANSPADLPDCQVYRVMKASNFVSSKCLWNSECFTEHIEKHKLKITKSKFTIFIQILTSLY